MYNGVSMNLFLRVPCLCIGMLQSPHNGTWTVTGSATITRHLPSWRISTGLMPGRFSRSSIGLIHTQIDVFAFTQQVIHHINQCGHALTVRLEHLGCQLLMTGQSTNNRLLHSTGEVAFHSLLTGVAFHLSHDDIAFTGNR
ncbi:Uncharacterised protein [Klebsiella pneumoniae]|nr:Uncharacterised protein [Klebsiella pneumoniae]